MRKLAVQNSNGISEEMEIVSSFLVENNEVVVLSKGEMHNETMHKVYISIVKRTENNVCKLTKIEDETLWGKIKNVMTEIVHDRYADDNHVFSCKEVVMEGCKIIALVNDDFDKLVNAQQSKGSQMEMPIETDIDQSIPVENPVAKEETSVKSNDISESVITSTPSPSEVVEPVKEEENIFDMPEINPANEEPKIDKIPVAKDMVSENESFDNKYDKVIKNLDSEIEECEIEIQKLNEKLNRLKEIKEFTKISHADNKAYAEAIDSVTGNV